MKFGQYLLKNSIPAWSSQYLDYQKLKHILNALSDFENNTIDILAIKTQSSFQPSFHSPNYENAITNIIPNPVQFDLSYLLPLITDCVQKHYNDHSQNKVLHIETEFIDELQFELNKISQFYHEQSKYFSKQTETLLARSQQTFFDDASQKKEKRKLRKLFRIKYHAIVHKLSNYRSLNVTAIHKICKKHDKRSCYSNLQTQIKSIIHKQSNFGNNSFEKYLINKIENAYGQFCIDLDSNDKNKKKCEIIAQLRTLKEQSKEQRSLRQYDICRIGFYSGCSISLFMICILLFVIAKKRNTDDVPMYTKFFQSYVTFRTWYILRASILVSIYLALFAWNLHIWKKKRFNHPFIFEIDPFSIIKSHNVLSMSVYCMCVTMMFTFFYVLSFIFKDEIIPIPTYTYLCLFCVFWIIMMIYPGKQFRATQRFILSSLWRQVRAPFSEVYFVDFFIADQWCSLFTIVVDLTMSICYFSTGEFLYGWHDVKNAGGQNELICSAPQSRYLINLLRFYPYWVRFAQCMRRYWDTNDRTHLVNAGKYSFAVFTVLFITSHEFYKHYSLFVLKMLFSIITTIYAYLWDIKMDWGLLHFDNDCKYVGLRSNLRFRPMYYYIAMLFNFLFRVSWAVAMFPRSFHIRMDMHYFQLGLAAVEVLRRCIWNIFRLENEHLNNVGNFRVVIDIPPFIIEQDEDGIDDDDDIDIELSSQDVHAISMDNSSFDSISVVQSVVRRKPGNIIQN